MRVNDSGCIYSGLLFLGLSLDTILDLFLRLWLQLGLIDRYIIVFGGQLFVILWRIYSFS